MKTIFTSLIFLSLCSCGPIKGVNSTIFLVQKQYRLYNSKGEDCLVSGYTIMRDMGQKERYKMTTYHSNCDTWEDRYLEEFELPQWGIRPKGELKLR
jgi:hypothetical protein